jgi:hypothetical protein
MKWYTLICGGVLQFQFVLVQNDEEEKITNTFYISIFQILKF